MGARRANVGPELEGSPRRKGRPVAWVRISEIHCRHCAPSPPTFSLPGSPTGDAGLGALRSVPRASTLCQSRYVRLPQRPPSPICLPAALREPLCRPLGDRMTPEPCGYTYPRGPGRIPSECGNSKFQFPASDAQPQCHV